MMRWSARGAGLATAAMVAMAASLMAGPADAQQKIRGVAEVQYSKLSMFNPANDVEWWLTSVQLDYSSRFRKVYEFASQLQFSDQKYIGRPDRQRLPLGSLRLAHPLFGLYGSYRPIQVTDARNVTTSQQELNLTGYFQQARLPRLSAAWNRRNQDASGRIPGTVAVRRSLMANYDLGRLNLHAGYADLANENRVTGGQHRNENNLNAGTSARFDGRRANTVLQYDYNQSHRRVDGARDATSRIHSASANGGVEFSARTSANLSYSFRNVATTQFSTISQVDHDGTLSLIHRPFRTVQLSGGGGVRSVSVGGLQETESFVMTSASAEGNARPGWKLGAGASQSWNWLPGDRARPVQSIRSNTRMRFATGLEAVGEASLSRTDRPVARTDTISSASQVTVQAAAGLRAVPLRSITLNANLRRYRTGATLRGGGPASVTYTTSLDWRASDKLQLNGSWGRAGGFIRNAPDRSTLQASVQWTPSRSFQTSGTYTRANQQLRDPGTSLTAGREAYGVWLAAALTRDLHATIRYTEADPGLPTRARQVSATLSQSLWR
jgi:hypothetical protein